MSTYFLPADEEERSRLNRQNRFFTDNATNGKLIYVPVTLHPGDEVLETATGTGIWLLDLAKDLPPTISLTGIDIEARLFPLQGQHPPNISFIPHSVTDLPKPWTNKFKLINQRLITPALTAEQWDSALSELLRVLAPGGWIQLFETCPETKLAHSGPNMTRIVNALSTMYKMRGLVHDLPYIIDRLLTKTGFVNVHRQTIVIAPRTGIISPKDADTDTDSKTREDRGCIH